MSQETPSEIKSRNKGDLVARLDMHSIITTVLFATWAMSIILTLDCIRTTSPIVSNRHNSYTQRDNTLINSLLYPSQKNGNDNTHEDLLYYFNPNNFPYNRK